MQEYFKYVSIKIEAVSKKKKKNHSNITVLFFFLLNSNKVQHKKSQSTVRTAIMYIQCANHYINELIDIYKC